MNLYSPNLEFQIIQKVYHEDMKLIEHEFNKIIPGNHLFLVMQKKLYEFFSSENIFFSTIKPNLDFFDGRHTTFLLCHSLYEELKSREKNIFCA